MAAIDDRDFVARASPCGHSMQQEPLRGRVRGVARGGVSVKTGETRGEQLSLAQVVCAVEQRGE
jgi:hypothetical protein